MPIIKSAKKKLRVDKRRAVYNLSVKNNLKSLLKKAEAELSASLIKEAVSAIDKAARKGLLHKNTAARKKSRLMKKTGKVPVASAKTTKSPKRSAKSVSKKSKK